jgi:peptidoglycan hydrolase-like protein with peptidoglycan-binding domain
MTKTHHMFLIAAAVCGMLATNPAEAGQSREVLTSQGATETRLSRENVMDVQRRLATLDFYNGALDGSWGPMTTAATSNFQESRGLQQNGMPTEETLAALRVTPTHTGVAVMGSEPSAGGVIYREDTVRNDTYTTRSTSGSLSVVSDHQNGSTCGNCTNGIFGTGGTSNMHSNEY